MKKAAVIGDPISHSLSPAIFNLLKQYGGVPDFLYEAIHVPALELGSFLERARKDFIGVNVTLPHKEKVLDYVDDLSPEVARIGAANVIRFADGKAKAHNTDVGAILRTLDTHDVVLAGADVLLFGAGGAAKAACEAFGMMGARSVAIVNRDGMKAEAMGAAFVRHFPQTDFFSWQDGGAKKRSFTLVVNATSVGMDGSPIIWPSPFELLDTCTFSFAFDLIYRPAMTTFLKRSAARGATTIGGLEMLIDQAMATWSVWLNDLVDPEKVKRDLRRELTTLLEKEGTDNLFLCGFMGAGKSSVGKIVAEKTGRSFFDIDQQVQRRTGRTVGEIFQAFGEPTFREIETELLNEASHRSHQVIALGGGTLLRQENLEVVLRAGTLVYLNASKEHLAARLAQAKTARPLLADGSDTEALFRSREPAYLRAPVHVVTDGLTPREVAETLIQQLSLEKKS